MKKIMMLMKRRPRFILLVIVLMTIVGVVYVQSKPAYNRKPRHQDGEAPINAGEFGFKNPDGLRMGKLGEGDINELENEKMVVKKNSDDIEQKEAVVKVPQIVKKEDESKIEEVVQKEEALKEEDRLAKGLVVKEGAVINGVEPNKENKDEEGQDKDSKDGDEAIEESKDKEGEAQRDTVLRVPVGKEVHKESDLLDDEDGNGEGAGDRDRQIPANFKPRRIPEKPMKLDKLKPPDHLDGVRMEQDGHLNRDYKKEIFLGNHEEFEQGTKEEITKKLEDVFHRVDTNHNNYISQLELEEWIVQKVQEHFDEAAEENVKIFKALDEDNDGFITWNEFHVEFLLAKGHNREKAEKHAEDYETIPLQPEEKEQLIRYKFRWADADEDPQDNQLTEEEFKSFRHPEQSTNMLSRMVQDIMDNIDKDHNGKITEEEFAALPPGEVEGEWKAVDRIWQEERRKEFKKIIDINQDGILTDEELKTYVDPQNPNHASQESHNLIQLADTNKDGQLSMDEVQENSELFLGSKMVNTGKSFHDEF